MGTGQMGLSEHQEQVALIEWANWNTNNYPELELLFSIPNGGRRDGRTGAKMKREGVKAGVPDLCLPVARGGYHALWLEMKAGKGRTTASQDWWFDRLSKEGHQTAVCWGYEAAREVILEYLKS